jgi:CRISPR-associated protein Csm5
MKVKVLSPVHIGSGERKTRMNFILKDNKAYFINGDLINSLINSQGLTDKFIQWATQRGNDISQFLRDYPMIERNLLENPLYVIPIKDIIDREVVLHIKDSENRFFIPGSSIKGAIRTALIYTVLAETKPDINQLLRGIPNTDIKGVLGVGNTGKYAGMEIEKFVLRAGLRRKDGKISYGDARYDLLKFIHFSDAYPIKAEYSIMPVRTFSSVTRTQMNIKSHITNVEVIESGDFICNLEVDMKGLLALRDLDEKDEWIGLKEKLRKTFGFYLTELKPEGLEPGNLKQYENRIIGRLLEACAVFYQKKMERDWELINDKEIKDGNRSFKGESLKSRYPKITKGVVQLGFGGGWKGKTTGLYFDRNTIELFRKRYRGRWSGKFDRKDAPFSLFPKTLRVAFWVENNKPFMFPLGWVTLEP